MAHHRAPRLARRLAALSTATLLAAGVLVAAPSSAGAAPADTPLRYVALGDSYSAASGVLPLDLTAPPQCLRSTRNYPHVLAARLGAQLTDVTCGAAETGDLTAAQYPGVAPQLDALRPDTQLVTMTIGGNDSGVFINAILQCGVLGTASLGLGSPCNAAYGDSFERTIRDTTYPALVAALGAVHQRAPQARVAIIGYPSILPATGGCFPVMPVASGDVPYLRSLQATLNDAVARAAQATATTYVDMAAVSEGHDACQPLGTRWIEPVLLGTNPVIVHPNALGEARIAEQVLTVLGRADPALVAGASGQRVTTKVRLRVGRTTARRTTLVATLTSPGSSTTGTRVQVPGARVVLQRRAAGGAWRTVRTGATTEAGRVVFTPRLRDRTTYRVKARASALHSRATSRTVTVRPRR